jgi:hypothetical protein
LVIQVPTIIRPENQNWPKSKNPINFTLFIYWLSSPKILCSGHFTTLGGYALNCHTCGSPAQPATVRYLHHLIWICSGQFFKCSNDFLTLVRGKMAS